MPITLAIETSQRRCGVALRAADGSALLEPISEDVRLDEYLMPAIDRIVTRAGLRPGDLEQVGVSIGPGGFTGLRIAVTTAKMLAETIGVRIIAVESALVAANSNDLRDHVDRTAMNALVISAAKGDQVWATKVRRTSADVSPRYKIERTMGLIESSDIDLSEFGVVAGDRFLPDRLRSRCAAESIPIVDPQFDPAVCLALAEAKAARSEFVDPLALIPLYAREPEAVRLHRDR